MHLIYGLNTQLPVFEKLINLNRSRRFEYEYEYEYEHEHEHELRFTEYEYEKIRSETRNTTPGDQHPSVRYLGFFARTNLQPKTKLTWSIARVAGLWSRK
jgi:hypothetical protein